MEEVKKQGTESLFVPYKIALELKELGFNEGVLAQYRVDGYLCWGKDDCSLGSGISDEDYKNNCFPEFGCRAALWQQAFDWFREKYNISGEVYIFKGFWNFDIEYFKNDIQLFTTTEIVFKTYEEARLECLKKLIEIVKNESK